MHAHAADLRAEIEREDSERDASALCAALLLDWRTAELTPTELASCEYAEKLTRTPQAMTEGDVERLRDVGLDDASIHDLIQVTAYFNYINRVADALGVEDETFVKAWEADSES